MKQKINSLVGIGIVILLLSSCDSKKNLSTDTVEANFTSIYANIISKNCVQCHEPAGSATINNHTQIDFSTQTLAYQGLTTLSSTGDSANLSGQCNGVPLVKAGSPSESYLLATLATEYHHSNFYKNGCTPYSPDAHAATISTSGKEAIVKWITDGAL